MSGLRLTRRRLLFTAGSTALGIAVVGTVPGCQASDDQAGSTRTTATPTAGGTTSAATPDQAVAAGDWRRVDLSFVSAYLLVRGREVAVVDLGTEGSVGAIEAALKAAGAGWDAVRHVILTHRHPDHAGGLAEVAPLVSATLYAGKADVAGIDSPVSLTAVADGDDVFGLRIIDTPGHTAGHVCVFDSSTGVLVAGDALRTTGGLAGSDPRYTADPAQAAASVRKLAGLDVRAILPGHGAPLTTGAAEALAKLAAKP